VTGLLFMAPVPRVLPAQNTTSVPVPTVEPRPEDVASIDGIMHAFYDVISGPAGAPRQWSRDRSLYIPDVHFVSMSKNNDRINARVMTHQQFVDGSNEFLVTHGFYEIEIHRVTRRFGNIAHVLSTYESRERLDRPVTDRGVNSLELFWDGKRWWIAAAIWDEERPDNPIPADLLP
jgi:hypothetical protein